MYKFFISNEILLNISYAEEYDYRNYKRHSDWMLRYDPSLNKWGVFNTCLDVTLFALWWGSIVLATIWK